MGSSCHKLFRRSTENEVEAFETVREPLPVIDTARRNRHAAQRTRTDNPLGEENDAVENSKEAPVCSSLEISMNPAQVPLFPPQVFAPLPSEPIVAQRSTVAYAVAHNPSTPVQLIVPVPSKRNLIVLPLEPRREIPKEAAELDSQSNRDTIHSSECPLGGLTNSE